MKHLKQACSPEADPQSVYTRLTLRPLGDLPETQTALSVIKIKQMDENTQSLINRSHDDRVGQ